MEAGTLTIICPLILLTDTVVPSFLRHLYSKGVAVVCYKQKHFKSFQGPLLNYFYGGWHCIAPFVTLKSFLSRCLAGGKAFPSRALKYQLRLHYIFPGNSILLTSLLLECNT